MYKLSKMFYFMKWREGGDSVYKINDKKKKSKKYWRQNKQKNGFTDKIWLKLIFNEKRGKIYTGYTLSANNVQV